MAENYLVALPKQSGVCIAATFAALQKKSTGGDKIACTAMGIYRKRVRQFPGQVFSGFADACDWQSVLIAFNTLSASTHPAKIADVCNDVDKVLKDVAVALIQSLSATQSDTGESQRLIRTRTQFMSAATNRHAINLTMSATGQKSAAGKQFVTDWKAYVLSIGGEFAIYDDRMRIRMPATLTEAQATKAVCEFTNISVGYRREQLAQRRIAKETSAAKRAAPESGDAETNAAKRIRPEPCDVKHPLTTVQKEALLKLAMTLHAAATNKKVMRLTIADKHELSTRGRDFIGRWTAMMVDMGGTVSIARNSIDTILPPTFTKKDMAAACKLFSKIYHC